MNAQQSQALNVLSDLALATLPMRAPERDCRINASFKAGDEITGKYKDGKLVSLSHWDENDQLSTIRRHKAGWLVKVHGEILGVFDSDVEFKKYMHDNFFLMVTSRFGL